MATLSRVSDTLPDTVLALMAHPDDVDYGAAGTLAKWVNSGARVVYCIVTDGEAGGNDVTVPEDTRRQLRRQEQRDAGGAIGVDEIVFLGLGDGILEPTLDLRRALTRVIRTFRPGRIVTHSPIRNVDRIRASHPDHIAVGEAAFRAVYPDARNPFAFPELLQEGLEPHVVRDLWVMGGRDSNVHEDISSTISRKADAVLSHVSQHPDPKSVRDSLFRWAATIAKAGGLPEGSFAESFRVVVTE